ncbi:MAG: hypothetical protein LBB91_02430 [Clostridiales bacterium]|jgi:hypothetical protein|nr:hypothetical protein [Clostridiales bacterium]
MTNKIKSRIQKAITIVVLLSFIFSNTGIPALATGLGNTIVDNQKNKDNMPSSDLPEDWVDDPILDFSAWEEQPEQVLEAEGVIKLTPPPTIIYDDLEFEEELLTPFVDEEVEEEAPIAAGEEEEAEKLVTAPFAYQYDQNESVSLNTGALSVSVTDLVFPGKNGLDLVIGRTYDSSDTNLYVPSLYSSFSSYDTRWQYNTLFHYHFLKLGWLGCGWRFNFPFIELVGVRPRSGYLHLPDGRVYYTGYNENGSGLVGYPLKDLQLVHLITNEVGFDGVKDGWTLFHKDGKKEFFDAWGRLIGIRDRFDNTIKFEYSVDNITFPYSPPSMLFITITDSVGRIITISSQDVGTNGKREFIIKQGSDILTSYTIAPITEVPPPGTAGNYMPYYYALEKTKDKMNRETHYSYTIHSGDFNSCPDDGGTSRTNIFVDLTTITHPTGGQSQFVYGKAKHSIFPKYNGWQELYRVTSRENFDGANTYNHLDFSYSAKHHTGYPLTTPWWEGVPPPGFTYWTTVANSDGVAEKQSFDCQHLKTVTEYSKNGVIYEKTFSEYNMAKLPKKIDKCFYSGVLERHAIECFEYDSKDDVSYYTYMDLSANYFYE